MRIGRKPVPKKLQKSDRLHICVTPAQGREIRVLAAQDGLMVSTWLRRIVLRHSNISQ